MALLPLALSLQLEELSADSAFIHPAADVTTPHCACACKHVEATKSCPRRGDDWPAPASLRSTQCTACADKHQHV
eukprot:scaffold1213_cov350-Prasinococcus_capsulatus_cf.AAC.9